MLIGLITVRSLSYIIQHNTLQELNNQFTNLFLEESYWFNGLFPFLPMVIHFTLEFFVVSTADETVFLAPCAILSFQFQIQLTVAYKFFSFCNRHYFGIILTYEANIIVCSVKVNWSFEMRSLNLQFYVLCICPVI